MHRGSRCVLSVLALDGSDGIGCFGGQRIAEGNLSGDRSGRRSRVPPAD